MLSPALTLLLDARRTSIPCESLRPWSCALLSRATSGLALIALLRELIRCQVGSSSPVPVHGARTGRSRRPACPALRTWARRKSMGSTTGTSTAIAIAQSQRGVARRARLGRASARPMVPGSSAVLTTGRLLPPDRWRGQASSPAAIGRCSGSRVTRALEAPGWPERHDGAGTRKLYR